MTNIDFLPTRYRDQSINRRAKIWQLSIFVLFGALIAVIAILQNAFRVSAVGELEEVNLKHITAVAIKSQHDMLQVQMQQARADADLYAYLHHPWPRTQVLFALRQSLPEVITLTQVSISRQPYLDPNQRSSRDRRRNEQANQKKQASSNLPARQDLLQLRQQLDKAPVVVDLSGHTTDALSLHRYLAELNSARMFSKASLVSLESLTGKQQGRSQFVLQLVVQPGYGQPNGPLGIEPAKDAKRIILGGGAR
ncbi:MAG: hypothetical protein IH991_10140 [Planctomycetes bacterium]|nr:hypothetical protein [Planctomycetota bacterium]